MAAVLALTETMLNVLHCELIYPLPEPSKVDLPILCMRKRTSQRSGSLWSWCVELVNWTVLFYCVGGPKAFQPYSHG